MAYLLVRQASGYREETLSPLVSEMLDRSGIEWSGKKVLVKPNLLGPFPPDSGVITHPLLVKALRRELRRRGCRVMVGDNPGVRGYGMVARMARVTGMDSAAGEDFVNLSLRPRTVRLQSPHADHVSVCSEVFEVDHWISVPKFKTHISTVITGAIKNSYGLLVGGEKARLHSVAPRPEHFGELLVEIYALRPPDLVIMDAVIGMEGNGPSGGSLREVGLLLSSDNGGAVDLAACRLMGVDPLKVPSQRCATERGLAPARLEEIQVEGHIDPVPGFRVPSTLARLDPGGILQRTVFRRLSRPRLSVDRKRCTACASCVRGCPAEAITLEDYPRFDTTRCIGCYCCYELCPQGAVKVGRLVDFLRR
ncbi:DUF362 domain-containing protein [Candidatus Solincola tengchongensis]|uniref:DUF362 domain-containing protein n=1 Tax=Candidatus Solincola tengchongensis TaxID=2900693 RepID=UPI00257A37A9|nr:DUF362 domain-containing protein [Candidatus Solincola tengchongensis]